MAAISSKKLLPSTEKKEKVFLVPYTNIVPSTPKLGGVKPAEGKKETAKTSEVNEKLSEVVKFFRYSLLLKERDKRRKRREQERKRFEESESKLETKKLGKKQQQEKLAAKIPGSTIFDKLARFTGFTLLGFVFNNFSNLLPALNSIGSVLAPAAKGIGYFVEGLFSNTLEWIDKGYKAYDAVGKIVKDLGGENYERLFNEFSGTLNLVINGALLAGAAGLRGGLFKPQKTPVQQIRENVGGGSSATAASGFSRYTLRTIKDTAPIGSARVSNAMLRTSMGLPSAKKLPTKVALRDPKFALAYRPQKPSYTSARDKAIAKSIVDGATNQTSQALRKAGVGVIDDAANRNTARNVLRAIGFGDTVGPNEPLRPSKRKSSTAPSSKPDYFGTKPKVARSKGPKVPRSKGPKVPSTPPRPLTTSEVLGQAISGDISRLQKAYKKLGFSNTDLKSIVKDVDRQSFNERKAAFEILKSRGLAYTIEPEFVPTLERITTPEQREQIKRNKREIKLQERLRRRKRMTSMVRGQSFEAPSVPKPGQGVLPKPVIPKVRPRGIGRAFGRIPIVGPLIDFTISLLMGDPIGKAAAGAVGAAVGSAIGGALVGSGTFGLGAFLGAAVGGFIGDLIARSLYDAVAAMSGTREKYNQGGVVASRQIKSETKPKGDTKKTISPVGLQSRFSEKDLKTLYGDSVGTLAKISGIMTSPGGFVGSLMSSSINLLFGQKFDDRLLSYIRQTFGRGVESNVRSTVDTVVRNLELFLAYNQKTKKKGDEEEESDKNMLDKIVEFFRGKKDTSLGPAPGDALERRQGETPRPADLDPSIPMADDEYVLPDGSILKPGMEVGSLQMTPTYAKHMEFTYAIQPVMVG